MLKILGLGAALIIIIATVSVGTFAYFNDTQTSTGNTLTAGTLDLKLTGGTTNGTDPDSVTGTWTTPSTWKPVDTTTGTLTLHNDGSLPMATVKLTVTVADSGGVSTGPNGTSSDAEYKAEGGTYTGGTPNDDNTAKDDVSTKINITALTYDGHNLLTQTTPGTFDNAAIQAADAAGNHDHVLQLSELGTISGLDLIAATGESSFAAGGSAALVMTAQFDSNATNIYQGDVSTISLSITGEQAHS